MNDPLDPNQTVDSSSVPADSLDAGLAAGSAAVPDKSTTADRYQLCGEIARGSRGAVLRGRDVDLGRDLAIKVLLEKHANNPSVARRFLEEGQIGGQLQHPGVVPVYDIGRFGDRPFFTMKLVKGLTLAAILGNRTDPTVDRPRLLSIALQLTQTLAYAHAKGVIHRDLKPADIMVGAFGEVQVMDWGLAKVLAEGGIADEQRASRQHNEAADVTRIRTVRSGSASTSEPDTEASSPLGTPAYMPPEQANGEVTHLDRRADVFALGAILCEILTGKPPYVGCSAEKVRRKATNGDLSDALTRLEACGADPELITLTKACLSPEASDRPRDARAVADALTAYLDGLQARLHQAELAEAEARARAIEETKRRRLTLTLVITVLSAVTLCGGGWLWVKAERDAQVAQVSRKAHETLNLAIRLREQARAANVGGAALFAQAREQTQRAKALVESGPADAVLQAQVRQLQTELDEEDKDRTLLTALDAARLAQAETQSENVFGFEHAVPLYRKALRAYGLLVGDGESAAAAVNILQRPAAVRLAIVLTLEEWIELASTPSLKLSEPDLEWLKAVFVATEPADDWTREMREIRRVKDPARRRHRLQQLAKSAVVTKLPAPALTRLALQLCRHQDEPSAVRLLRRAQEQYPADFWINHDLGCVLRKVTPPEREEAIRFLTAAVALRPNSPGVYFNLGLAFKDKSHLEEAITCYRKAIELDPKYHAAYSNLGNALKDKGLVDEAIECYRQGIELDPKNARVLNNLGNALHAKGQLDEAIASYRKGIDLNPKLATIHKNLASVLRDKGELDGAIASYREAMALDPKYAGAYNGLGALLCDDKKDYDAAIVVTVHGSQQSHDRKGVIPVRRSHLQRSLRSRLG